MSIAYVGSKLLPSDNAGLLGSTSGSVAEVTPPVQEIWFPFVVNASIIFKSLLKWL